MTQKFYKILRENGMSPYQRFGWSLPKFHPDSNTWTPGNWEEVAKYYKLERCSWGLHAATAESLLLWYNSSTTRDANPIMYELEFSGRIISDRGSEAKPVGYKARLVRQLPTLTKSQWMDCQLFVLKEMILSDPITNIKYCTVYRKVLEAISGDIDGMTLRGLERELENLYCRSQVREYLHLVYSHLLRKIRLKHPGLNTCDHPGVQVLQSVLFTAYLEQLVETKTGYYFDPLSQQGVQFD